MPSGASGDNRMPSKSSAAASAIASSRLASRSAIGDGATNGSRAYCARARRAVCASPGVARARATRARSRSANARPVAPRDRGLPDATACRCVERRRRSDDQRFLVDVRVAELHRMRVLAVAREPDAPVESARGVGRRRDGELDLLDLAEPREMLDGGAYQRLADAASAHLRDHVHAPEHDAVARLRRFSAGEPDGAHQLASFVVERSDDRRRRIVEPQAPCDVLDRDPRVSSCVARNAAASSRNARSRSRRHAAASGSSRRRIRVMAGASYAGEASPRECDDCRDGSLHARNHVALKTTVVVILRMSS